MGTETTIAPDIVYTPPTVTPVSNEGTNTDKPKMYMIVLLNDHTTAFDCVIEILRDVIGLTEGEANTIMIRAHREGSARVRAYSKEVADMKMAQLAAAISERGVNGRRPHEPCELKFDCTPES